MKRKDPYTSSKFEATRYNDKSFSRENVRELKMDKPPISIIEEYEVQSDSISCQISNNQPMKKENPFNRQYLDDSHQNSNDLSLKRENPFMKKNIGASNGSQSRNNLNEKEIEKVKISNDVQCEYNDPSCSISSKNEAIIENSRSINIPTISKRRSNGTLEFSSKTLLSPEEDVEKEDIEIPEESLVIKSTVKKKEPIPSNSTSNLHECDHFPVQKKAMSNSEYNLMTLIRYQKIVGYWEDLNAVNEMAGINIDHIDGIEIENKILEKECIATIVAIAILHVKSPEEKNVWNMIEEKAINWLKSNLLKVNITQTIEIIEKLIK